MFAYSQACVASDPRVLMSDDLQRMPEVAKEHLSESDRNWDISNQCYVVRWR
eukprot:SAG31_NODE_865_length_11376_cov_4.313377_9_plen_52_part_00